MNGDYNYLIGTYRIHAQDLAFTDRTVSNGKTGLDVASGTGSRVVNCISTDNEQGVTSGTNAIGTLFYGNLVKLNGHDSNQGHNFYVQNAPGVVKTFRHNVSIEPFGYCFHVYGSLGTLDDFLMQANLTADAAVLRSSGNAAANFLFSGSNAIENPQLDGNHSYYSGGKSGGEHLHLGDGNNNVNTPVITNNYCVGGTVGLPASTVAARLLLYQTMTLTGNTLKGVLDPETLDDDFPSNTYSLTPTDIGNTSALFPNEHETQFAWLVIYNQAESETVSVSMSGFATNGQTVRVANAQGDITTDTKNVVVSGGNLAVDMRASEWTVQAARGWTEQASFFPRYGLFLLEKI